MSLFWIRRRNGEVLVDTEARDNPNTSVTNTIDYLVAELIQKHFAQRFEEEEPAIIFEHYEPVRGERLRRNRHGYDRVSFQSWAPRLDRMTGVERLRLGHSEWRFTPAREVALLIGEEEAQGGDGDAPRDKREGRMEPIDFFKT